MIIVDAANVLGVTVHMPQNHVGATKLNSHKHYDYNVYWYPKTLHYSRLIFRGVKKPSGVCALIIGGVI